MQGTNELIGTNPEIIVKKSFAVISGNKKKGKVPKFWDDQVSRRIVEVLLEDKI